MDIGELKALNDRPIVKVATPEWPGTDFYVRAMSVREASKAYRWIGHTQNGDGDTMLHARIAAACVCDSSGVRIFADSDADWLADKNSAVLWRIFRIASELNGLGESQEERVQSFAKAQSGDSSSA